MAAVLHLRIHRANDVTWCGRSITFGRKSPLTNVETVSERAHKLTSVRFVDGKIDRTPLTRDEKAEVRAEWDRLHEVTSCKGCRAKFGWR